jgi:hypothetical protein
LKTRSLALTVEAQQRPLQLASRNWQAAIGKPQLASRNWQADLSGTESSAALALELRARLDRAASQRAPGAFRK